MSEPITVLSASTLKSNFQTEYGNNEGYTECSIFELEALEAYIANIKQYLINQNQGDKIKGIAGYFGYTTSPLRGTAFPDIVVPPNRMCMFLAPVLYEEDFVEDTYPGSNPSVPLRVLKPDSLMSLFGMGENKLPSDDSDLLAFDINNIIP